MAIYGRQEIAYWQVTPVGVARFEAGRLPPRMHPESKRVLEHLIRLGGTAEWDELKLQTGMNPQVIAIALRRLIDLGYVTPVALTPPVPAPAAGRTPAPVIRR